VEGNRVRLSDRILDALELALDQNDLTISETLGHALEESLTRFGGPNAVERRDVSLAVIDAMDRLDRLRKASRAISYPDEDFSNLGVDRGNGGV
jgi:hypothetical protein